MTTEEDDTVLFFEVYVKPELSQIKDNTDPLPYPPEIDGDPLDLTPEQETRAYQEILALRQEVKPETKPTLEQYFSLMDTLRAKRGNPEWRAEEDREILSQLEDWYPLLSSEDQEEVEKQGDRAWPCSY